MRAGVLCMMIWVLAALPAQAHVKSQSYSQWRAQNQTLAFAFSVDLRRITQLSRLYDNETGFIALFDRHLRETLSVTQKEPCRLSGLSILEHVRGKLQARGNFVCQEPIETQATRITIDSFHAVSSTHVHYARLNNQDTTHQIVLNKARRSFDHDSGALTDTFSGFFAVGFSHVIVGLDHMLFLLALMLAAARPSSAIWCITGFTLGHSLTLGLAVLGLIAPDMPLIEAMIGLTIAVAANQAAQQENEKTALLPPSALAVMVLAVFIFAAVMAKPYVLAGLGLTLFVFGESSLAGPVRQRFLPVMTICFGLVHGAGFAEGLLDLNFNQNDLLTPMLGFNLGVEAAQLVGLCGFYILIMSLQKLYATAYPSIMAGAHRATCLILFGLGMFWFAQRLWS
ncbi:MAG: HupE/UreJ family protein [Parvibaculales bacterium]